MFGIPFIGDIARDLIGHELAKDRQEDAQHFAGQQSAEQRTWQERMRSTQYQTSVKDLEAAGLNPMLAYHNGGAGVPSGGIASAGIASPSPGHTGSAVSMQSASQIAVNDAAAEKLKAEAKEIEARTPRHAVDIDHVKQQIGESAMRIERIIAETSHHYASAKNVEQQTINLKETVPQIRANVENLRALTQLHKSHEGLSDEQAREIRQRVQQNLPELERVLKNLERIQREMAQPGHAAAERAADSFVGELGAYLRAINPLKGFLDSAR